MNFLPKTNRYLSVLLIAFPVCRLAQEIDQPAPPPTLQQRMQKSLARQMESVAAMQKSVNLQRAAIRRQTGEVAEGDFFLLPRPAPMLRSGEGSPVDPEVDDPDESENGAENNENEGDQNAAGSEQTKPNGAAPRELPPVEPGDTAGAQSRMSPGKMPFPAGIQTLMPISADIAGIAGVPPLYGTGDLDLQGILLRQLTTNNLSAAAPAGSSPLPKSSNAMDYIRQILGAGTGFSPLP
jgi:hypothetical protein